MTSGRPMGHTRSTNAHHLLQHSDVALDLLDLKTVSATQNHQWIKKSWVSELVLSILISNVKFGHYRHCQKNWYVRLRSDWNCVREHDFVKILKKWNGVILVTTNHHKTSNKEILRRSGPCRVLDSVGRNDLRGKQLLRNSSKYLNKKKKQEPWEEEMGYKVTDWAVWGLKYSNKQKNYEAESWNCELAFYTNTLERTAQTCPRGLVWLRTTARAPVPPQRRGEGGRGGGPRGMPPPLKASRQPTHDIIGHLQMIHITEAWQQGRRVCRHV